ncbi:MAG: outer membrane beta-barrel protein [Chitinophagales bacterium]
MRKLILALIAMGTIATANAQEPKSILLYGDASVRTNRDDNLGKTTNWDVNAGVGYQFNHNWTAGLQIMWGQDASKEGLNPNPNPVTGAAQAQGDKNTFNSYSVGPFVRYSHYIRKSEIFFYYSQLDFDYAGGYHTNEGNPADAKHTGVYVGLYPALGINVGRGLALNFQIGGINYKTDKYTTATYSTNTFNFTFGHQWNVGLSKNFNCGHKMHSHHEPGDEVHRRKADKMEDEDDAAPKPKKRERSRDDDE